MAGGDGVVDRSRIAVTKNEDGIKVSEQHLVRPHDLARLIQRRQEIQIHNVAAESSESIQAVSRIATDVKSDAGAEGMETVDEFFFIGPDKLFVEFGPNEGCGGIPDADEVDAGIDLNFGEAKFQIDYEFEQIAHECRIIVEIEHEGVDAAQIGAFGTGTFDPTLDDQISADPFAEQSDGLNPIVHPAAAEWIRRTQGGETGFVGEKRSLLVEGGRLIIEELDRSAAIGGFASWIGHGVDVIEAEYFSDADLSFGEQAMIGAVVAVADAGEIGCKHHCNGHEREVINRMPIEVGQQTFTTVHGRRISSADAC